MQRPRLCLQKRVPLWCIQAGCPLGNSNSIYITVILYRYQGDWILFFYILYKLYHYPLWYEIIVITNVIIIIPPSFCSQNRVFLPFAHVHLPQEPPAPKDQRYRVRAFVCVCVYVCVCMVFMVCV
jgi:hypothetical protein